MRDPALLELLLSELEDALPVLAESVATLVGAESEAARAEAAGQAVMQIDCIRLAAEAAGLPGLSIACERLTDNLTAVAALPVEQREALDAPLSEWPERVMEYLLAPDSDAAVVALASYLVGDRWPEPMDAHATTLLAELLADVQSGDAGAGRTTERQQQATSSDLSLVPGDDVNPEVFAAFLDDAPQQGQALSTSLQRLAADVDARQELDRARRLTHTLKGAAAVAGVIGIANLTHHMEDLLDHLAGAGTRPPSGLLDVLIDAADCLEVMIDALRGLDRAPDNGVAVLQAVLDWANSIDRGEAPTANAEDENPDPAAVPPPFSELESEEATEVTVADDAVSSLRVDTDTIDALFRYAGELSVANAQVGSRVASLLRAQQAFVEQDRVIQQRLFELEDLIDIRDVASSGYRLQGEVSAGGDFDRLEMDQYNELHGCSRALAEAIADWRELRGGMAEELTALRGAIGQQTRLQKDLEDTILATRLVPVSSVESRLQRAVRQACRATGKQASLHLSGGELMIDTELLQSLLDPLGHLLRNAVDHGIEMPDERRASGKSESGRVTVRVRRDGNLIEVVCEDDGRGLDFDAVRHRAMERGLLDPEDEQDTATLSRLVFLSGFSTRDTVTRLSGRGVGLDVVHDRVRALKGTVDLDSESGLGSRFRLRLPAALVTVHVLLVDVAGQTLAIPSSDLIHVPVPGAGAVEEDERGSAWFELADSRYPYRSLGKLLGRQQAPADSQTLPPVILARMDGADVALQVDRLLGSASVVIKGFGKHLPRVRGVLGATILGDGQVAPVLDLAGLERAARVAADDWSDTPVQPDILTLGRILIVDDSLSVRRSLTQVLEDSGYAVVAARDGIAAVRAIEQEVPDVVIADLEMPRMNGLELTAHIRATPDTATLPVVMLTSRSMQKHRDQADRAGVSQYLTKPFRESELLDVIERLLPAASTPAHASA